jgi:RHH-type transcriptional regulator, proline utilization regulon repressor / proline dehydrogenase / delta 1-pyrroline-5-carboxylate dehydrogenase
MFKNFPLSDFTLANNREALQTALDALDSRVVTMALVAGPIINGVELSSEDKYERHDPSHPDDLIGTISFATEDHVKEALNSVEKGFIKWRMVSVADRCALARKVANRLIQDRFHLTALIIREAGKPWKEADADVAEAIDFCNYYADELERISPPFKTEELTGEDNYYLYEPRGIAVVIAPWNFPLAIACGMVMAALVAGNTVILKPSEQTSLIAAEFAQILLESGLPNDAFAFLPGWGEKVGKALVESPKVNLIAFTGSKPVGLEIIKSAAIVHPGQYHIKRVIAELGGKNAIIIDEDADLDEAIKGAVQSAFGFSGQKCSACSRIIVVGDAYETFLRRFCDATASLIIGPAKDPMSAIGPVIDQESANRIKLLIENYKSNTPLSYQGEVNCKGYFVAPSIFHNVDINSDLWREEIFGPVVACRKADTLKEAFELANNCAYALTGGFFSRSPKNIALAKEKFRVGNLYINRACTGALVGRQPFGGFKLSGIGSKAGGRDYLLQFLEPRTITENTLRRGFAP